MDRTREHISAWIRRLNWIADLPLSEREGLAQTCRDRGGHQKSGEFFATANPLHVCWYCSHRFQVEPDGSQLDWDR